MEFGLHLKPLCLHLKESFKKLDEPHRVANPCRVLILQIRVVGVRGTGTGAIPIRVEGRSVRVKGGEDLDLDLDMDRIARLGSTDQWRGQSLYLDVGGRQLS
jgi:hypothetical protein